MQGNCTVSLVLLLCITCFPAHARTLLYSMPPHLNLRQLLFFLPVPNWQNVIICIINRTQMSTTILWRGEILYPCKIPLFIQPFITLQMFIVYTHCALFSYIIWHQSTQIIYQELKKEVRLPTLRRQHRWQLDRPHLLRSHEECSDWPSPRHGHEAAKADSKTKIHLYAYESLNQIKLIVHIKMNFLPLFTGFVMYNILHTPEKFVFAKIL